MTDPSQTIDRDSLSRHAYINLETYRKSGVGVKTPVWFALDRDQMYVRTQQGSGKVKRLRRNPRVRLAPSDAAGAPLGPWLEGTARLASAADSELAANLFRRKYGLQYLAFDAMMRLRRGQWATLQVEILPPAQPEENER